MDTPAVHLIVADTYNDAIRIVDGAGIVTTLAGGSGPGFRDGTAPPHNSTRRPGLPCSGMALCSLQTPGTALCGVSRPAVK